MSTGKALALIAYLVVVGFVIGLVAHSVPVRAEEVAACEVPLSTVDNPQVQQTARDHAGYIFELKGDDAAAFQQKVEKLIGSQAPFHSDFVAIGVFPSNEVDIWPVAFSEGGCIKSLIRLPADFIRAAVTLPATVPANGEKVD